jgi:hypothetical protein
MAIVTFGAPLSGLRGSIGGVTYSANKSGPYAKLWAKASNVRTPPQSLDRLLLASLAARWRTLDAGDRADWDEFAADPAQELTNSLGEGYYISGFLWWNKISRELIRAGRDPLESGWNVTKPTAPAILTLVISAGAVPSVITYADGTFGVSHDCIIDMCLGQSIGAIAKPMKPLCLGAYQTPGGTSLDISAEVAAAFATPHAGQRAFAEISKQYITGYRSAPTAMASDVVA